MGQMGFEIVCDECGYPESLHGEEFGTIMHQFIPREVFAECPCCGYPKCGHDHKELAGVVAPARVNYRGRNGVDWDAELEYIKQLDAKAEQEQK